MELKLEQIGATTLRMRERGIDLHTVVAHFEVVQGRKLTAPERAAIARADRSVPPRKPAE